MSDTESMRHKRLLVFAAFLVPSLIGLTLARELRGAEYPLGRVHFAISCSDEAQRAFDRGVALLHHMTYPRAKTAFERVAELDPSYAMAHWGLAMTLFQPLWPTRPGPEELQQGWESVQEAKALAPPTEREQLHIAAAEAELHPKRFNSLLGAARAARDLEDEQTAQAFYSALLETGARESNRVGLREARAYLGAGTNRQE